jgi:MinD-like ATPase involved in chromosome partitioning or flagellar assembly
MQVLLIGAGTVTSRLSLLLSEQGHSVSAQIASFTPQHIALFDFRALIVISPEASVTQESLVQAAEQGKLIFVVAGIGDGMAAWAAGTGVPTVPYPPSDVDINKLLDEMRRGESGTLAADEQYRRTVLGSDMSARIQSGMAVRKIAITSPKGGAGKTTLAANLAVALALSGITTYLVDADGNAGALQYHLRLERVNTTMIGLLRREIAKANRDVMSDVAAGAAYLNAFTPLENLPTLKVLPGLVTDDLGDEIFQQEEKVAEVIQGLYEAGVAAGGVVIMDVGINPAHVVHRAALKAAEGIAIVIKPEIPDLAETRRWISRMINSLANVVGKASAHEFVGSRVKLCYNQVVGDGFKSAHKLLQQALSEDQINLALIPNGIIPIVDPRLAAQAVNSDRREDILIWRYKKEKLEELAPFAEALLGFAAHFVPAVQEGAVRTGLLRGQGKKKRRLFGRR